VAQLSEGWSSISTLLPTVHETTGAPTTVASPAALLRQP